MEKKVKRLGVLKWLCIPLGFVMFLFTVKIFGPVLSCALMMIFAAAFWDIVKREQRRIIGHSIAETIKEAISETGNVDNFIEIKSMKSGIIARVYLINAREKARPIHKAIASHMEKCKFKKYLWIMQLTDMPGKGFLRESRKILNEQLIDEIIKQRNKIKNRKGH